MNLLQALVGLALLLFVFADLVVTTLTVNGGGPFSQRLALAVWTPMLAIHGRRPSHRLLSLAAPLILLLYFLIWFLLLWMGWSLIFASGDHSILQSPWGDPAGTSDLLYFVGFTIITLGVGDFVPNGGTWQMLTVIASMSGFFVVTMLITYLLPVVSAVVEKRQLATYIHSLGHSPQELLARAWSGNDYHALSAHLLTVAMQINRIEKQHLAYPVLHYFHALDARAALPHAVAVLDEALSVLEAAVSEEQRPPRIVLGPVRDAITGLLGTLRQAFIAPGDHAPPVPPLPEQLQARHEAVAQRFAHLDERRRLLLAWVRDDGWGWTIPEER